MKRYIHFETNPPHRSTFLRHIRTPCTFYGVHEDHAKVRGKLTFERRKSKGRTIKWASATLWDKKNTAQISPI